MTDETTAIVPSIPVERPDPKLIQELFDKDPLLLSDRDLDLIISEYRADRANYLQAEAEGKKGKAKTSAPTRAPAIPVNDQLDLSDLGLEL